MALNPHILIWAREAAGLSVDEAAHALGFKNTQERTAAERLQAMEAGTEEPSRSVLLNMARVYHRSLLVFYLSEPPRTSDRGQDFRRAPGANPTEYDPTLDALIRDIRGRQGIIKDLLDQADPKRVDYVSSVTMDISPVELARRMTVRLGFSLDEFRRQANVPAAFGYLREKVEASGAFVLLLGNLGSHHTNIPSGVFRGYAIADPVAPFIVVNDQDASVAWAFTTLHELTHLWLGTTGVSGGNTDTRIEVYCNSVAGEMLLPEAEMAGLRFLRRASLDETVGAIAQFATSRKISRAMVAYKLLRVDIITQVRWRELDKHYADEWNAAQAQPASKEKKEGGPSYYVVKRHRLGHAVVDLVKNSLAEGFLTYTRASQVLGVKPRNVDPLIYTAGTRGGR
ncbi:XRE family transcriptional regulator [Granulicella mallensis]|uniref:Zn-dependent peptidase ImmA (M78 family)/transcriptional regulator with XRE-family HTH domain n=1 Tax=Granulicella mallensis TaxID=940614 RepID=A0A7W7ZPA1_9BACT|nr:XRE family transcriptional regulator [Granulicella mallensis]MBB5063669.1 Zn-dependent peptidase ImmA (M78 family)/transcriptional regulator with XRE-family HTH domain [Granulicella mallensis]